MNREQARNRVKLNSTLWDRCSHSQFLSYDFHDALMGLCRCAACIDRYHAPRLALCNVGVSLAHAREKCTCFLLETIFIVGATRGF